MDSSPSLHPGSRAPRAFGSPAPKRRRFQSPAHESSVPNGAAPRREYIVGLDFGTTFSSAAVSYMKQVGEPRRRYLIGNYTEYSRAISGRIDTQVPSRLWYPRPNWRPPSPSPQRHIDRSTSIVESIFSDPPEYRGGLGDPVCEWLVHGWGVQSWMGKPDAFEHGYEETRIVNRPKLLLDTGEDRDDDENMQGYRDDLKASAEQLMSEERITRPEDIIGDYLVTVLGHVQRELEARYDYKEEHCSALFVFCVPVTWKEEKNVIMSMQITHALRKLNFGVRTSQQVPRLFMVNEAEASSTYMVDRGGVTLRPHEAFILLDCGGGSIDGACYTVSSGHPYRLEAEVGHPTGRSIGSSHINDKFYQLAMEDLKDETYLLVQKGETICTIVSRDLMPLFEIEKRNANRHRGQYCFPLPSLKQPLNKDKPRLKRGQYVLTQSDMDKLFKPAMAVAAGVMFEQIKLARRENANDPTFCPKVIVVGGFSESPSLGRFLQKKLQEVTKNLNIKIDDVPEGGNIGGTAYGAVLRAEDMSGGPRHVLKLSIGLLRTVPYNSSDIKKKPEFYHPWIEQKNQVKLSEIDGKPWLEDTIEWILVRNQEPRRKFEDFIETEYVFAPDDQRWLQKEPVYISSHPDCTDSYYTLTHPKNAGKVSPIGTLELDLTDLKQHVSLKIPKRGKPHYPVTVLIQCRVIGLDIKFSVRWPAREDGETLFKASFPLVAALAPGAWHRERSESI